MERLPLTAVAFESDPRSRISFRLSVQRFGRFLKSLSQTLWAGNPARFPLESLVHPGGVQFINTLRRVLLFIYASNEIQNVPRAHSNQTKQPKKHHPAFSNCRKGSERCSSLLGKGSAQFSFGPIWFACP